MRSRVSKWMGAVAAAGLLITGGMVSRGAAGVITVCKGTGDDACMFNNIQTAVNAAKPGDVIQIMDTEVYSEQVTIDGRGEWNKPSIWDGKNQGPVTKVNGGKNGITIKYAPPSGARLFGVHARPVIKWKDVTNRSPKNEAESTNDSELPGGSSNYSTCGALRILNAKDITLDGIEIRGGGAAPFVWSGVWGGMYSLIGGNAAVVVHGSGRAVIRNCVVDSGYFGISVKDRNTGGVFGNPNRNDNDMTIPLSQFGQAGNHLFEYNKIKSNVLGVFFESSWDLGSSIRYNLIYNNQYNSSLVSSFKESDFTLQSGGGIFFKDVKLSPVAIYNNTFYNNSGNILGGWKKGAQHLVFNNIFGKPGHPLGTQPNGVQNTLMEKDFPNRMHNSIFSAASNLKIEKQFVRECQNEEALIFGQEISGIGQVLISNGLPYPSRGPTEVRCLPPLEDKVVTTTNTFIPSGGYLVSPTSGTTTGDLAFTTGTGTTDNNIRWLETSKSIEGTEDLFESTNETSADFLRPKWTHKHVISFIKGQGWPDAGIKNSDGSPADIGAIPYTGRAPTTTVRIKPSSVVLVSGTRADAKYFVTVENGTLTNAKISLLRWVAPLPVGTGTGGAASDSDAPAVPFGSITKLSPPTSAVSLGGNSASFTIPAKTGGVGDYGFFEVVITGKDANGNDVVSDIGFLPYRKLEYSLKLEVFTSAGTKTTTVTAGEQYRLNVKPCKGSDPSTCEAYSGSLAEVSYDLLSDVSASMYLFSDSKPLVSDKPLPASGKDYAVYFTRAGQETIMGSGIANVTAGSLVFLGTADITVKPGAPDHVSFLTPIPKSRLGGAPPPTIFKGAPYEVQVMVQDKWDNPVDVAVPVSIKSESPAIGNVSPATATTVVTGAKMGIAAFTANVTDGATRQEFDLTASVAVGGSSKSDVGRLRVGRSLGRFEVFFSDNGPGKDITAYYDPSVIIDGRVGEWYNITAKVVVGDTVVTSRPTQWVSVVPSTGDKMIFSATQGGAAASVFDLKNGVATFWVSTAADIANNIQNGSVSVYALNTRNPEDIDASVSTGFRDGINFKMTASAIAYAVVYGDGQGRPDSVIVKYKTGSASLGGVGVKPSKVTLTWGGKELSAFGSAVSVRDDLILCADLRGVANRPVGITSISGLGRGIVSVTGGIAGADAVENGFDVYDGIGPVVADAADGSPPKITEYVYGGYDTLMITISEELSDPTKLTKLLYTGVPNPSDPVNASTGVQVDVFNAVTVNGRDYTLVVDHASGIAANGWIRLAGVVSDKASIQSGGVLPNNPPHPLNRWVQLKQAVVPPDVVNAWYTGNNATGKPNFAYVVFSKPIDLNGWFAGGSVTIGVQTVNLSDAAAVAKCFTVYRDTLRINLTEAAPSIAVSGAIRTGGDLPFTLGYNKGTGWSSQPVMAADRAAPVLAKEVFLKAGAVMTGGSRSYPDTLIVTYSEKLNEPSLARSLMYPVTIRSASGTSYRPTLTILKEVYEGGYYKVSYLTDATMLPPAAGDSVQINYVASIGDNNDNVQTDPRNKWQPLRLMRYEVPDNPNDLQFNVTVRNNPLNRGAGDQTEIVIAFNTSGLEISATIRVYDNRGNTVLASNAYDYDVINWSWDGHDKKGRLVDIGTYRFKAVCNVTVNGGKKSYTVERSIGVVRGGSNSGVEVIGDAPIDVSSGSFTAGANPAARLSGVAFFWDGFCIKSGSLSVYDASGNLVKRVDVAGESAGVFGKRKVGEWDLTDGRGRAVAEGSYVVKGAITAKDGQKRSVSAVIGVGR